MQDVCYNLIFFPPFASEESPTEKYNCPISL